MKKKILEEILENLDNSCFPHNFNWNDKELYLKGLNNSIEKALKDNGYIISLKESQ